jgi:hypothetical protein
MAKGVVSPSIGRLISGIRPATEKQGALYVAIDLPTEYSPPPPRAGFLSPIRYGSRGLGLTLFAGEPACDETD